MDDQQPSADEATVLHCRKICQGKAFWNKASETPRKCTQSQVQLCEALAGGADVVVRKDFAAGREKQYAREKAMLRLAQRRCASRKCGCGDRFPTILAHDDDRRRLALSNCGEPVTPSTIPSDCAAQVHALGALLSCVGVQHGDLVPHNVLLQHGAGGAGAGTLSLVDFGRARALARGEEGDGQRRQQRRQIEQLARRLCDPATLEKYMRRELRPVQQKWNKL
eukprot:g6325.t1